MHGVRVDSLYDVDIPSSSVLMTTTLCMTTLPLNTAISRMFGVHAIIRIHARKLYLASLFRMFDEADYHPSQDPVYEEIRSKKTNKVLVEKEEEGSQDTTVCKYKNVLKNGIVVGACEGRYDHFVRMERMHEM